MAAYMPKPSFPPSLFTRASSSDPGSLDYYVPPTLTTDVLDLLGTSDTLSFTTIWETIHNTAKQTITKSSFALITSDSSNFNAGRPLVLSKIVRRKNVQSTLGRLSSTEPMVPGSFGYSHKKP